MSNQSETPKTPIRKKIGFFNGLVLGGLFGALITGMAGVYAQFNGHGMMMHAGGGFSEKHREMAVDFVLASIDADESQRAHIQSIVQDTLADVKPMFDDREEVRAAFQELLTQPQVDHAALEAMRISTLEKADVASQRMAVSLVQISDVLTQEQRTQLFELHKQMRRH
ncbi:MAG: Spy/CpxP family protein refolding chaperone [Pseudomonadota bacterium]